MDLASCKIETRVADSDRFFWIVTVTLPNGSEVVGDYESGCSFTPCTGADISEEDALQVTDWLNANEGSLSR